MGRPHLRGQWVAVRRRCRLHLARDPLQRPGPHADGGRTRHGRLGRESPAQARRKRARREDLSLSVVIVTYRSDRCIEGALASVRSQLPEAEIVVVDNASDDETRAVVRYFGGVRLVEQEQNVGFGRACNTGARHATGTRVLFVNPDVRIVSAEPAELARLWSERLRPVGWLPGGGSSLDSRGQPSRRAPLAARVRGPDVRPAAAPRNGAPAGARAQRTAPGFPGALLLVDKEEFLGLGGFDPRFFLYYEDKELSARYRKSQLTDPDEPYPRCDARGEWVFAWRRPAGRSARLAFPGVDRVPPHQRRTENSTAGRQV